MNGVFRPHMEILPPAQKRLWTELGPTAKLGFTLYGGTAIALRLGHRTSVDFDFFSEKPLDLASIRNTFPFMAQAITLQDQPNSLTVIVPYGDTEHEHVKISFFGEIDFGRISEPEITDDHVLNVASLDDLMATKVKVILQRIEAKDYRDISAMVAAGVSLSKGLASARAMFGSSFQPSESLKAMVYFKGGDLCSLSNEEKSTIIKAVSEVRDLPNISIIDHQLTQMQNLNEQSEDDDDDFGMRP
ncbi:nucleotidyl transferase AbiEii/AbiGii toxin family protein [Candidatus Methylospira mobilis]|uniref:nucleotidyl transferase AbiEii/AbiGii toxin family protein n=1 Tax=Candidatus Methylospira mobilis TaxID=1808979 RepID=UPI0028E9BEF0|nr:nucleotidyl transferase AbiEii/AbiGii toxin family protein [Candidatus Methylospira mobilis]WNV05899.1 nucleotidyl transferase AbiEii/AbiGii toxin family protein [Candidatus Methylospira mobilis]